MARDLKQLTVFISGTDETDAEKAALRRVVDDLNRQLERTHSITLRVIGWPDDIRPGVNTDPQAEISRQSGSHFDIYVGLLGTRFGTPTPRAGSGTEDEFNSALARFKANSQSVRVLFYFKRAVEDPFGMDIDQLQRVRWFRSGLSPRGVVYRDFRDTAEFAALVKEHVYNLIVDEWQGPTWSTVGPLVDPDGSSRETPPGQTLEGGTQEAGVSAGELDRELTTVTPDAQRQDECEEQGFLDYMSGFHESASALTEVTAAISRSTERVNEQIRMRTAESESLQQQHEQDKHVGGSRSEQLFVSRARETVDHAAEDLDAFVTAMSSNVENYRIHSRTLFAHLRNAMNAGNEFQPSRADENREALAKLIEILRSSRDATSVFQATISHVPALTGRFKRARKRTAEVLGEFVAEMLFTIEEAQRLLDDLGGPQSVVGERPGR